MMLRCLDRSSCGPLALTALIVALVVPGVGFSDEWTGDDPARSTADDLDDHKAHSSSPSDHEAESHDMVEGHSEDPDDMVVEADQMDVVGTDDINEHEGSTTALQDLRVEAPDGGANPIHDSRLDGTENASLSAGQLVAKRHLERAEAQAAAARNTYGEMMQDDYPRGAARIRIIEHRDETMSDLEQAREEFDEAMGN
jgi:hypothetical protein